MDTKDTAPSVTPAKPAPKARPGEPEPEEHVPSVPLSGLGDDSWEGLGAAFGGLFVGGTEGKEKEKEKDAVDMGVEEEDPGDDHEPSDEVPFDEKPSESSPSASDHPAVPSPITTTLPATHPATSSPTTTPPMADCLGFTGMPHPTYGVTPADQRRRNPPGTTPSRGTEQVRRRASPAPLPWRSAAAGTMSPIVGRPLRAPHSCPVNPR